jgi:soluble lytic murein transglycosylase-like protein
MPGDHAVPRPKGLLMTGVPATNDHLPRLPRQRRSAAFRLGRAVVVPLLLGLVLSSGADHVVRVKRGDTLWALARRHNTTVAQLRELNNIPGNSSLIYAGQRLRVSGAVSRPARTVRRYHTVVRGDSLIKIARRYHKSPGWIAAKNRLPKSRIVILGQRLIVSETRQRARSTPRRTRGQRVSRAYVRTLIRAEARRAGIDPSLALALAYMESGFQQHVISHAGAVGVMQVMPQTGVWVSRYLVGRPLDLARVEDNVVAGVRYLALLIRNTGRTKTALAGYYQGLASVRRYGMFKDTKNYVRVILVLRRRF